MPSDERTRLALAALSGVTEPFRTALAMAAEQVQRDLAAHAANDGRVARFSAELGPFADGRISVERFASVFTETRTFDPPALETMAQALQALRELVARQEEIFLVNVVPGASVRDAAASALEQVGRAFAAARAVEMCRAGRDNGSERPRAFDSFPFRRWSKAQRLLAPPLVLQVDGSDLHAGGLSEFLDGRQKFVLVVRGESPPAPLVRLITPDIFVLQTTDPSRLNRLLAWPGPGVAALVPDGAAQFVHDPAGGPHLSARLTVASMPEGKPLKALGGLSVSQQAEELDQLRALAVTAAEAPRPVPGADGAAAAPALAAGASDPVEKLANWLLSQADLD